MDIVKYDIERLGESGEIDAALAIKNFSDPQVFFDALTVFSMESPEYLTKFNTFRVSTRDEVRKSFFQELKRLRDLFSSLCMAEAIEEIKYLESASFNKDTSVLDRELEEFHKKIGKISNCIASARVVDAPPPPPQAIVKPVILAVDDMPTLLSSVVMMLQDQYTVMAVTSGNAALKVLEKHTPSLFLLDIEMPQMNGYELASMIRTYKKFENTPIIFLTAKGSRDAVITSIKHGGNDYILKPVDKELLLKKLQQFIAT